MAGPSNAALVWGMAISQTISWGTLFTVFPLFVAPMEAELGWSRATLNGALTAGLLAAGLCAIPAGRWVDRHGGRWLMSIGGWIGALLLLGWAMVDSLWLFFALWIAIGAIHATALSEPAYAVIVANARDARRAIAGVTFITGFCSTIFLPLGSVLIESFGWRQALLALAALQIAPGIITAWVLRGTVGSLTTADATTTSLPLRAALRRRAFWALAVCFCAHTFMATGMSFHLIPLLQDRGLGQAALLLVVGLHGPCQVGSRAVLFTLGKGAGTRVIGSFAMALLPLSMLVLGLAGDALWPLLGFTVLWGVSNGLITIVRASGVAEILGQAGYGQISGAIATASMLPRTAAPLALALLWQWQGGYGQVPWLLAGLGVVALLAFVVAALDRG